MTGTETTKTFQTRFEDLMIESGKPLRDIANDTGISRAALNNYANDKAEIGINNVVKLAKYFNVSADYLLGLSDAKTNDKELQAICDFVGLNECAVLTLNDSKQKYQNNLLNNFIGDLVHLLLGRADLLLSYCLAKERLLKANNYIRNQLSNGKDFSDIVNDELAEQFLFFQVAQYKLSTIFNEYLNGEDTKETLKNLNYYLDFWGVGD